jgi:hypothetical protein
MCCCGSAFAIAHAIAQAQSDAAAVQALQGSADVAHDQDQGAAKPLSVTIEGVPAHPGRFARWFRLRVLIGDREGSRA